MKVIENNVAFLELAVIESVFLIAGSDCTLFKLVDQKFLIGWHDPLESSYIWIKITSIQNKYLHLIRYTVLSFENVQKFFGKRTLDTLVIIEGVILMARVRLAGVGRFYFTRYDLM